MDAMNDPEGLIEKARLASRLRPSWHERYRGDPGLLAGAGAVGLFFGLKPFVTYEYGDPPSPYWAVCAAMMLVAGLYRTRIRASLPVWAIVRDGVVVATAEPGQFLRCKDEVKRDWQGKFPDSNITLEEITVREVYVDRQELLRLGLAALG